MWNRNNMHPSLGYDKFYCYTDSFTIDEKTYKDVYDYDTCVNIVQNYDF